MLTWLEPIKHALVSVDFTFVDALIECDGDPDIVKFYRGPFYQHYDKNEGSVRQSYEYIIDIIDEDGPFDGVVGFSQGAAAAATTLLWNEKLDPTSPPLFKFGIFFCSTKPLDADDGASIKSAASTRLLPSMPTVHVVGQKDPVKDQSLGLFALADPQYSRLITHEAGHCIPKDGAFARKMQDALEWAVLASGGGG